MLSKIGNEIEASGNEATLRHGGTILLLVLGIGSLTVGGAYEIETIFKNVLISQIFFEPQIYILVLKVHFVVSY